MHTPLRAEHDQDDSPSEASSSIVRWWSSLLGLGGTRPEQRARRKLVFETCEPRIVFTAQPVAEFFVDYYIDNQLQDDLHTNVANGDAFTGLSSVRDAYGLTGKGQTVVVIDTGIAYDHPALGGGYGANHRVVGGYDFAQGDANPYDSGPYGSHGTHVAGIIGSSDARYPGIAPEVDLVALRVFNDQGAGRFDWVEQALRWVIQHRNSFRNPITTINLSIGSTWNANHAPDWAMLEDEFAQLRSLGIFTSVAAGNSFTHYNAPGLSYPAASSHVVPVASVDNNGQLSYFSQRNSRVIAAPGRSVVSTVPDYIGNLNGRNDDFAAFSGTSMAAPYVAGASVLIREAYAFAGMANVNQDTIYNLMVNTADTIYDSATNQSYKRLNLQRALQAIMPADDYGSTAGTAHHLGTIVSTASIDGTIGRLDDRDFFRFTAGSTGRVTLTAHSIDAAWQYSGGSIQGNRLSFDVVAGQSYTFGLGSSSGLGHYRIDAEIESVTKNWGTVRFARFNEAVGTGNNEFLLTAYRGGVLSIDANFARAAGNVTLQVYNSQGALLGTSTATEAGARLDIQAQAGQTYRLNVGGNNANVTFNVANLVSTAGNAVYVHGTGGNEQIAFWAGEATHRLSVNGFVYTFDAGQFSDFRIDGGSGVDTVTVIGGAGTETASLRPGGGSVAGSGYRVELGDVERIIVDGRGGADRVTISDTPGNDTFVARPNYVELQGPGILLRAINFGQVDAFSTGGRDQAVLHGSAGNDSFVAMPALAQMSGGGYVNRVHGFATVQAHGNGGDDRTHLIGSSGNDTFTASPRTARLTGATFDNQVFGFASIMATTGGGVDQAVLRGSSGNDTYIGKPDYGQLYGTGYNIAAFGFQQVRAIAGDGGHDVARLNDSIGSDTFIARPDYSRLFGAGFEHYVFGFNRVAAHSFAGGADRAFFYDSAGNDLFVVRPHLVDLLGDGFHNQALNFRIVTGFASSGFNHAIFRDLVGNDTLVVQSDATRLYGSGFDHLARGFNRVDAFGTSTSQAHLHDVALQAQVVGDGNLVRVSTRDINVLAYGFHQVWSHVAANRTNVSNATDYVFNQLGS